MTQEEIISTLSSALNARLLTASQKEAFEGGLSLLESRGKAAQFVSDSRRFRDYHRRVRHLLTLLQTFDLADNTPIKRHVGRPTKQEQKEYAAQRKIQAFEEAKQSLFPEVTPNVMVQPLTYGGFVADPNGESIAATMPKLSQLRPFLSPDLQARVNSVRDLRNEMAAKAEQAKTMAEANERAGGSLYTEAEIAELATRAAEIESDLLPAIYNAVDREMGECYLRLSHKTGDPEYIAYAEKTFTIPVATLRTQFKPFYEKAVAKDPTFATTIAQKIANDRPEVKAQRDAAAKHKAEADAIIKYIMRKDKPATKKRVKGLAARIAQLRSEYSDIVSEEEIRGYEAVLANTQQLLNA